MREDVERWEAKYQVADQDPELRTEPLLSSHLADLHSVGSALDLASGSCHSSVFLAQQGYDVLAVDCSATGLAIGRRLAEREQTTIRTLTADLDEITLDKETYEECEVKTSFLVVPQQFAGALIGPKGSNVKCEKIG